MTSTPDDLSALYPTSHIRVVIETYGTMRGPRPAGDALFLDLSDALHNPMATPELRGLTGLDARVRRHVMATPGARAIVERTALQVRALLPAADASRAIVRVHVACRWGRHRSVAVAEETAALLRAGGAGTEVYHRDIDAPVHRRDTSCAFCRILAGTAPAAVVREWDEVVAIRPRRPVTGPLPGGHVLVIPRTHVADATVDPAITAATMAAAAQLAADTEGDLNLITSRGAAATQSVYHLHIHVVRRQDGDGLALPWTPSAGPGRPPMRTERG